MKLNLHGSGLVLNRSKVLIGFISIIGLITVYHFASRLSFQPSTAHSQDVSLPTCVADAQGNVDYTVSVQTGQSGFYWADAAGCINRPLLETWAVTQNPEEMGVPDLAQSTVVPVVPPPAGATNLYDVTYKVQQVFTISWTLSWLHTLPQGTLTDPKEVLITINKTAGSSLISHFSGNIQLQQISPTMTLVTTHQEVAAPEIDQSKMSELVTEIINRLRTGTPNFNIANSSSIVDFE